jgi:DNA recombination protein RmuC
MILALLALLILQLLTLVVAALLLLRKPPQPDPRQAQVPDQLVALDARFSALDQHLRAAHADLRRDAAEEAERTRSSAAEDFRNLRTEIAASVGTLGATLNSGLADFRKDNAQSAEALRTAVHVELTDIGQRLERFISSVAAAQLEAREALHARLTALAETNTQHQDRLRQSVTDSLTALNADNTKKLEEMRATVDEKLNATLNERLTHSFGLVTGQLERVHTGLGEMTKLSEGVEDLSRIFTNVKSRGGFAEVQLGMLLEQMLAPSQFVRNARVKPGTLESIEFAVRFPGHTGETLLPIDAKFPREDWERLEAAYAANDQEALAVAGKAFEAAIRTEADRICKKYINPPVTTPHAIMFLPTEGLYAEVMRRDALQAEIQSRCQVTIAGPSTLSAILTSFQMGFHMLALQEKGDEVWKVLESTKTEFKKFGILMDKVEKQVGTVQNTLREIGGKTTTINRTLREVSDPASAAPHLLEFESYTAVVPALAANDDEAQGPIS